MEKKSQLLFSGSHKIVYTFYIMAHVEIVATNIKVWVAPLALGRKQWYKYFLRAILNFWKSHIGAFSKENMVDMMTHLLSKNKDWFYLIFEE